MSDETVRVIVCPNCSAWEETPVDAPRHKADSFEHHANHGEQASYKCIWCNTYTLSTYSNATEPTPAEIQWTVARELCYSINDTVQRAILDGKIPKDWDGHEIREYIFVLMSRERSPIMRNGRKKRAKEFRNTLAITPL
jgi:hypothetical protein